MIVGKLHVSKEQPLETVNKLVTYRSYGGVWHIPMPANEVDWSARPCIGRINEYAIVSKSK
jgi:hypothetical protein